MGNLPDYVWITAALAVFIGLMMFFLRKSTASEEQRKNEAQKLVDERNRTIPVECARREKEVADICRAKLCGKSILVLIRLADGKQTGFETDFTSVLISNGVRVRHLSKPQMNTLWKDATASLEADTIVLLGTYTESSNGLTVDARVLDSSCTQVLGAGRFSKIVWSAAYETALSRLIYHNVHIEPNCLRSEDDRRSSITLDLVKLLESACSS